MRRKKTSESAGGAQAGLNMGQVERVLEFMVKHGLEEFEYAKGGLRIRLKKASPNTYPPVASLMTNSEIVVAGPPAQPSPQGAWASAPGALREAGAAAEDLHLVKSPIVGTFYEAPSPGAEPFVKVSDHVNPGQVLCIVEAMKLMNEIESDLAGEVIRVFVENGQPVEYGEPLFAIRPTHMK